MAYWLLKTEPDDYSFDDLQRDGAATWDGVTNALAQKHMRTMREGDRVLIYHTGNQRQVVGVAEVTKGPYLVTEQDKHVVFDLKPTEALRTPVPLSVLKDDPGFEGWDLLRLSRLSVVPTSKKHFDATVKLGRK